MRASVIVPARNASATLPRTLADLARQDLEEEYEVVVVDDGSTDASAELARAAPGRVKVVAQGAVGPGAARNAGVAASSGAAIAFCDADVFPTESWLRAGLAALADAELVQGRVLPDPTAPLGPFDRTVWVTTATGLWEAANLFVDRELFTRLGGFPGGIHPRHGKPLAEDVLFGYRALAAGARTAFCPEALAHHAVSPRGPRGYIAERLRLAYFPAMAAAAPELRRRFLHRRAFLSERTARLDLALAGAAVAGRTRSPLPLLVAVPYGMALRSHAMRAGFSPAVAAVDALADLVGVLALGYGSIRYRSPVL